VLDGALGYAKSALAEEVALQLGVQRDSRLVPDGGPPKGKPRGMNRTAAREVTKNNNKKKAAREPEMVWSRETQSPDKWKLPRDHSSISQMKC